MKLRTINEADHHNLAKKAVNTVIDSWKLTDKDWRDSTGFLTKSREEYSKQDAHTRTEIQTIIEKIRGLQPSLAKKIDNFLLKVYRRTILRGNGTRFLIQALGTLLALFLTTQPLITFVPGILFGMASRDQSALPVTLGMLLVWVLGAWSLAFMAHAGKEKEHINP